MGTVATFVRVKKWAQENMPTSFREYQSHCAETLPDFSGGVGW